MTGDGRYEQVTLEEAMTVRELNVWEERKSEEKREGMKREDMVTKINLEVLHWDLLLPGL